VGEPIHALAHTMTAPTHVVVGSAEHNGGASRGPPADTQPAEQVQAGGGRPHPHTVGAAAAGVSSEPQLRPGGHGCEALRVTLD
jgi:hypothetical protein